MYAWISLYNGCVSFLRIGIRGVMQFQYSFPSWNWKSITMYILYYLYSILFPLLLEHANSHLVMWQHRSWVTPGQGPLWLLTLMAPRKQGTLKGRGFDTFSTMPLPITSHTLHTGGHHCNTVSVNSPYRQHLPAIQVVLSCQNINLYQDWLTSFFLYCIFHFAERSYHSSFVLSLCIHQSIANLSHVLTTSPLEMPQLSSVFV